MVTKIDFYSICPKCKGLGIAQTQKGEENPCQMCNGKTGLKCGFIDVTMIMNKLNNMDQEGDQND